MKKKIILFGATGNTGSYLLKYALDFFGRDEYEIIATGRRETNFFEGMGVRY
jgi:UDP-glucose 4-epimerase